MWKGKKKRNESPSPKHEDDEVNVERRSNYHYKMFNFFSRKYKIHASEPPEDVKKTFYTFSGGSSHMAADHLKQFMMSYQGERHWTLKDAEEILEDVVNRRPHTSGLPRHSLSVDDFFQFLFSDEINGPIKTQVHQNMSAPLSHYYIYTGHNSYLTGNQLSSACSEVPIVQALQRGVRVIELDLWPGSNNEVNVLHGRTLTSPVSLIKCLTAIKENAFATSPYPVIITLEDHLTPELQAKVAEMISQIFGTMLFYPESECLSEFPSPESLQHRIIISTKPPKEYLESRSKENSSLDREGSSEEEPSKSMRENTAELHADYRSDSDHDDDDEDLNESDGKSLKTRVSEYKRLITIHAGKPKGTLKDSLKIAAGEVRRLSMSEQELEKASESHGCDVVRFTQRNILRIYPKGTRFDSSNYKPTIGWMHGAQMIAFNMQGYGRSLWLMHGFFRANGGCGYVRKPDFLMGKQQDEVSDSIITLPVKVTLQMKIYLGDGWRLDFSSTHFDTYSPPDFYTKIKIIGVPADTAKRKTKVIGDDWCPVWDEEFSFPLTVPELALLMIEVCEYDMSEKDDFGGQTCLPISELKPGIRSVPLYDKRGNKFPNVRLLIKFQLDK